MWPLRGHLAIPGVIFDCQNIVVEDVTGIYGVEPGMLLDILQCRGQPYSKEQSSQYINSVKVEKLCFKGF